MCGIAGVVNLTDERPVPPGALCAMADAIVHRGPDEDGYLDRPGLGLASRRLSIVGLADGRQPIGNEDRTVWTVFNGELFDYPEKRAELEAKGHHFATHTDTELLPHLWEEHGADLFPHLRGQFAFAVWDERRRELMLARDRFGICPLFWTVRRQPGGPEYLLFASEIKALFASGLVPAEADPRGLNHMFTFFAVPGPVTCFAGVHLLPPGHCLRVPLGRDGPTPPLVPRAYWSVDFPDRGQEVDGDERRLTDQFEALLLAAVGRRLRADVPVVSYLSGGVDSSVVVALAGKVMGRPIPTFTIGIGDPALNEEGPARQVARYLGTEPVVVNCGRDEVRDTYPELIRAAESPVIDTSCAALVMLAREVRQRGFKVALTGEGSDEWLAGYSWFKIQRLLNVLDAVPGLPLSKWLRQGALWATRTPRFPLAAMYQVEDVLGGPNAWMNLYGLMSLAKLRFFSPAMLEATADQQPFADLGFDAGRMRRWHPFHRSLAVGGRTMLAGLLLAAKGDRVAMNSSVETRYPFLDEELFAFTSRLHPRWKLRGLFRDKYILRKVAQRWVPHEVAWRRKAMFRAPMDGFHLRAAGAAEPSAAWVEQLLSPESLRKTGYFDAAAVRHWRGAFQKLRPWSLQRTSLELGLMGVTATQLWHHTFLGGGLADLPTGRAGGVSPLMLGSGSDCAAHQGADAPRSPGADCGLREQSR